MNHVELIRSSAPTMRELLQLLGALDELQASDEDDADLAAALIAALESSVIELSQALAAPALEPVTPPGEQT